MRIKAFTIVELIVTMIVLSLTMAIGYYCFQLLQQQASGFKKRGDAVLSTQQLLLFLKRDIDRAEKIISEGDSILTVTYGQETHNYIFRPEGVLRNGNDLYPVKGCSYTATASRQSPVALIDKITVRIPQQQKILEFSCRKVYTSTELLRE
jgi:prepilin-type N-terminal cleavage/methylation domain-containing protein